MNNNVKEFLNTLHPYDLYGLYWLGGVIFLLFILAILLRKNPITSVSLLLISFLMIFITPPFIYFKVHKYLYGTDYNITYLKQMKFANVLVIQGEIKNVGEENITKCNLYTFVTPPQDGFLKNLEPLFVLNPIKKKVVVLDEDINVGETTEFKVKFINFKSTKDINSSDIYIYRECYNENINLGL